MQLLTHQMHNFCNFYKKCQNLATSKHAPISSILSTQSLLVKYNRGSLVEQHIFKKYLFPYTFGQVYYSRRFVRMLPVNWLLTSSSVSVSANRPISSKSVAVDKRLCRKIGLRC